MSVYLPEVDAGLNPGALWVRICAGDELVAEHALGDYRSGSLDDVEPLGKADVDTAHEAAERHGEARVFIYDGDSGECATTIIVRRP